MPLPRLRRAAPALVFLLLASPALPAQARSRLGDEFGSAASLAGWKQFHQAEGWPSMTRRLDVDATEPGALYLEPLTSGWYGDFHAPFVFREVTGDFTATARLRVSGLAGGVPRTPWSLAGLMVRAPRSVGPAEWAPGGEDWLFVTTGVADDVESPVFETKTTDDSRSRLRLWPARAGWVELRVSRAGARFDLAYRYDGGEWTALERFDRPDLPATLQVGINAYTDWYTARPLHGDPLRFNTTVIRDGSPDLAVRVDWIRFEG